MLRRTISSNVECGIVMVILLGDRVSSALKLVVMATIWLYPFDLTILRPFSLPRRSYQSTLNISAAV